jgi:tetratricopeptide (TPR) repeat protein
MARREYSRAVPLLKRDLEKYPSNVRIRLQYADALAGAGDAAAALEQYDTTVRFYEENGLIVQAIAVKKKAEKLRETQASSVGRSPSFSGPLPKSPLFEDFSPDEREAIGQEMTLEQFEEGDIIITEGEQGSSLYVVVSGEVKVYLAKLGAGDFFGEVSVLTGKPRTATIVAAQHTELLRLDKDKLDTIVESYPRIRKILDEFYRKRANHTVEAMIDSLKHKRES